MLLIQTIWKRFYNIIVNKQFPYRNIIANNKTIFTIINEPIEEQILNPKNYLSLTRVCTSFDVNEKRTVKKVPFYKINSKILANLYWSKQTTEPSPR